MLDRRRFLAAGTASLLSQALLGCGSNALRAPSASAADLQLAVLPERVYKRTPDQNRLSQEHWAFILVVTSSQARKPVVEQVTVTAWSKGERRSTTLWNASIVAARDYVREVSPSPPRDRYRVAAFMVADSMAVDLGIDEVRCEIETRTEEGRHLLAKAIPIEAFQQKTPLVFPFVGRGLITQGGAWNDGHRNRSGMFAIDAIGLTERYAAMIATGDSPSALAGWGREIIAPAAGLVVVARGDRPDQPLVGESDPKYYVPEFPQGGDPGNHVVIDHGNGEFSMLAHFQRGSLRVRENDRVAQGQVLGLMGNSGDSSSPHVHHQLQSGPQWTSSDALPHFYVNGPGKRHDRGVFFDATR